MNVMNLFLYRLPGFLLLMGLSLIADAQDLMPKPDTIRSDSPQTERFAVVAYIGGGLSAYSAPIQVADGLQQVERHRLGIPATFRLMWHPDHRLRLGIETGWTTMYSYAARADAVPAKVYVSAIPMLLVYSMPITRRIAVFGGTGAFLVNSTLRYNDVVRNTAFSLGWMVAGSFTQPVSRNLGIAAEVKWLDATQTNDANFSLELQLVWRLYRWR